MKKALKRLFAGFLVAAMVFSVAGCGKKDTGSSSDKNADDGNTATETNLSLDEVMNSMPADLKGSTIKYMVWYDVDAETEGPIINSFRNMYGINVEVEMASYDDFRTELAGRIAAGNSPDVIRLLKPSAAEMKMLQPLDVTGFNFNDKAWDKQTMSDYSLGGKTYATNLRNTVYFDAHVIFYNKQILADYGLDDPYELWKANNWTWDKFWSMCQQFVAGGGKFGAGLNPRVLCNVEGVDYLDYVDGHYVNSITDPARSQTLTNKLTETLEKINNKSMYQHENQFAAFERGECAFFQGSLTRGFSKRSYHAQFKEVGELMAVPLPTSEGSKNYTIMGEYSAWGIPQGAKNAKAVPYFLRYMLDLDNYETSTLYSDPSMLECYDYLVESKDRYASQIKVQLTKIDNGADEYIIFNDLVAGGVDQVTGTLNKYSNNIQDAVDKANLQIESIVGE